MAAGTRYRNLPQSQSVLGPTAEVGEAKSKSIIAEGFSWLPSIPVASISFEQVNQVNQVNQANQGGAITVEKRIRLLSAFLAPLIIALALLLTGCGQATIVPIPDQEIQTNYPYEYQARISDGSQVLWELEQAPPGMKVDSESGRITWLEPPTKGVGPFQVWVGRRCGPTETRGRGLAVSGA